MSGQNMGNVLARRWYITLVGLVATAGLAALAMSVVPATYEASSYVLLVPPSATFAADGTAQTGNNPYLELGGLQPAVEVLSRSMLSSATALRLSQEGYTAKYNVAQDITTSGPVLKITTDDSTQAATLRDNAAVSAQLAPTLLSLQNAQNVRSDALITLQNLSMATKVTTVLKSEIRAAIIAVALGVVLTVFAAAALDGLIRRRKRRVFAVDKPEAVAVDGSASLVGEHEPSRKLIGNLPSDEPERVLVSAGVDEVDEPVVDEPAADEPDRVLVSAGVDEVDEPVVDEPVVDEPEPEPTPEPERVSAGDDVDGVAEGDGEAIVEGVVNGAHEPDRDDVATTVGEFDTDPTTESVLEGERELSSTGAGVATSRDRSYARSFTRYRPR